MTASQTTTWASGSTPSPSYTTARSNEQVCVGRGSEGKECDIEVPR
jgi:hypothetical protein